jgi:LCP family protein required for cell wall assembly
LPDAGVHPTTIGLTRVESAKDVDFSDGVVWILALGSDARAGEDMYEGRTDAIQLVGLDLASGRAAGLGIPRDSFLELPGLGMDRINNAMKDSGGRPEVTAQAVAELVGIQPDYVFVTGFDGFRGMVDAIGGVTVDVQQELEDDEYGLHLQPGPHDLDGDQTLGYARSREYLEADFARSRAHQQIMLGILRELRANEDQEGFMEKGTLSALSGLRTELSPTELYQLAQAVTLIRPDRVTLCVVPGTPDTLEPSGASIVIPDEAAAKRLGDDIRRDVRFEPDAC